jgi:alpha-ketoglutarate-dependent taurine dioxygenase
MTVSSSIVCGRAHPYIMSPKPWRRRIAFPDSGKVVTGLGGRERIRVSPRRPACRIARHRAADSPASLYPACWLLAKAYLACDLPATATKDADFFFINTAMTTAPGGVDLRVITSLYKSPKSHLGVGMVATAHVITPTVGLEVIGLTAPELLTAGGAERTGEALERHGVVVYREINIGDDDLLAFTRMLGTPLVQSTDEHRHPEIQTITLNPAKTNAVLVSYRQGNFHWHIDGATLAITQKATLLTAWEIDPAGGDTEFASTYAAYEALPDEDKVQIESLQVVHSFAHAQALANPDATEADRATWVRVPARIHPLVWKRSTGRRSLVLGATAGEVVGWSPERGRELLDRLVAWVTQPRFTLRHKWRKGDLVIWDNTGMLHRALPFEPTLLRLMHRTTLIGEESVA